MYDNDDNTETEAEHQSPYDTSHFEPEFRTTVHVHVETSSSDCDGPLYRSSTWTPNDDETSAEFFTRWMLSLCAYSGNVNVRLTDDGEWIAEHGHETDEGYHAEEHRSCAYEDCRDQRSSQRDVYAERMGY